MKIKVKKLPYSEVCKLPKPRHKNPQKSGFLFRVLMKELGKKDLKQTGFTYKFDGMDGFPKEPCLILMNHSSFIDLEIASAVLFPKPFAIVCTSDGFVGKEWLMRRLGCIPTNKFVSDSQLISDISYALKKNRTHVLMYPEASYSFDGTATALPRKMGVVLKMLGAPVVMITTHGAFSRDPLYNMLQKRNVHVSADIKMLFTKEELKTAKIDEVDAALDKEFSFDNFEWQKNTGTEINEDFRADGLERILFRCPYCGGEGRLEGKGIMLRCRDCGAEHELGPLGNLIVKNRTNEIYSHIPDWYRWERDIVHKEIEEGRYCLDFDCNVLILRDFDAVYDIGKGHLCHDCNGFHLTAADGELDYKQPPLASYGLYADYFWYELGDIICIGTNEMLYYCFPEKSAGIAVARARLAAEELYKIRKSETRKAKV